jgi:hypothetical protein
LSTLREVESAVERGFGQVIGVSGATGAFVTFSLGPLLNMPLAKADGLDAIVNPIINSLASVDPMLAVDVTSWLANADAALSAASTFDRPSLDSAMAAAGVERSACRPE